EFVRPRWQRAERRALHRFEELAPRLAEVAARAGVETLEQERDRRLQLGERVEDAVAERGQNPALGEQHTLFDLRLVPGVVRAGRQDDGAVVLRERGVGRVEV